MTMLFELGFGAGFLLILLAMLFALSVRILRE